MQITYHAWRKWEREAGRGTSLVLLIVDFPPDTPSPLISPTPFALTPPPTGRSPQTVGTNRGGRGKVSPNPRPPPGWKPPLQWESGRVVGVRAGSGHNDGRRPGERRADAENVCHESVGTGLRGTQARRARSSGDAAAYEARGRRVATGGARRLGGATLPRQKVNLRGSAIKLRGSLSGKMKIDQSDMSDT